MDENEQEEHNANCISADECDYDWNDNKNIMKMSKMQDNDDQHVSTDKCEDADWD